VVKLIDQERTMARVNEILDDAYHIENILILHQNTGTCIFFKSYSSKKEPELIQRLLTMIYAFGKNIPSQEIININSFQGRKLLISDGNFIRVAVLLDKDPSNIIKKGLMDFIDFFEETYGKDLADWKYELSAFSNIETVLDHFLFPSIILSHKLSFELTNLDAILDAQSKEVFNVANNLVTSSGRNAFYITTLIKKAMSNTKETIPDILKAIKELKFKKVLIPLDITPPEKKIISQLEINYLKKNVAVLLNLAPEEREKLAIYLAKIEPADRIVYIYCMGLKKELSSPPISSQVGEIEIIDEKTAKKELIRLKKNAKSLKKAKDYLNAIDFGQKALKIVNKWNFTQEFDELDEIIRTSSIDNLKDKIQNLVEYAKSAAARGNATQANQNYTLAYKLSLEVFSLGVAEAADDVKRYINKAIRYQK